MVGGSAICATAPTPAWPHTQGPRYDTAQAVTHLFSPGCSITRTKRRRYFWAAWWSAPPTHVPFRKPDASGGGASSPAEALAEAERQAGLRLGPLDALWAQAWNRILRGEDPWPSAASREPRRRPDSPQNEGPPGSEQAASVWSVLGITREATPEELKAAYRRKVLEAHPDQGGNAAAFQQVVRAYEEAQRRLRKPKPKRR